MVMDSFNMTYRDKDNILDQIYKDQIFFIFIMKILDCRCLYI